MTKEFEADYERYAELQVCLDIAEMSFDEDNAEGIMYELAALMKSIEAKGKEYNNIFFLYQDAMERGNALIDLSYHISEEDVPVTLESFRRFGIDRFTFSYASSNSLQTAWAFVWNGCRLEGLTQVYGADGKVPAFLFRIL